MSLTVNNPKKVLFVCVENSNRSQMAEAFARMLGGDGVEAYSAGSEPSGVVNLKAIEYMAELDYDLAVHQSQSLAELPDIEFDFVATMGCGDKCPNIKTQHKVDWPLPDPKHLDGDEYRQIRSLIADHVLDMLRSLNVLAVNN